MVINLIKSVFNAPEWSKNLPREYQFLKRQALPPIMIEALKLYGTKELAGNLSSPIILGWAKEVGGWVFEYYKADSIPWCGLFVGVCAKRAGYPHNNTMLSALGWSKWGIKVDAPVLGDVLIFVRPSGGHVGFYVGEDSECYHVLGGNQADSVNITRIAKSRLKHIRRQKNWKGGKRIFLEKTGAISDNEA